VKEGVAGRACSTHGDKRDAYRVWWESQSESSPTLGKPRCRWKHNIEMDLRETGWAGMNWIDLAEDRGKRRALVNTIINLRVQ
jgi:hypothetical protein